MSIRRCIPELESQNKLSRDQAERARTLFEDLERDYSRRFASHVAEALASDETVKRLEAEASIKKRQTALQLTAQQAIAADVRTFRGDDPGAAAVALLTHDSRAPYSNVERRADVIEGQAHAMMSGLIHKFSRDSLGRIREPAQLLNVVREAFGEDTGDLAAKELARAWMDTAEQLRLRFNAAGGAIGKLDKWGMPQVHNMLAVRAVSFDQWRDFIQPLLDPNRMLDETGSPMTEGQLELALRAVFDTITTEGWNSRAAGGVGGGKLANRRADSRFLVFRDAESWLDYNRRFGRPQTAVGNAIDPEGPIFDAMMSHIRSMSNDVAMMERLGPNPTATLRWIKDSLHIEARLPKHDGTRRIEAAEASIKALDDIFGDLAGSNRGLENGKARIFGAVRSWQSAAKLGSAVISALTDVGFQHVTRRFNGLPATNVLAGYAKMLNPGSGADRLLAQRLWLVANEATKLMSSRSRWTGEVMTGELASRLSESVMRFSGLSAWTEAGRWAFGREFWSHITDQSTKNWANINAPFRRQLERYGFSPADWDSIRATELADVNGSKWLLPENIADPHLAERLAEMIATEIDYAVPTASVRVTSVINRNLPRGTWFGEIGRSALLFKSFPLTVMIMHGRRAVEQQWFGGMRYAANLVISTTLLGALAWELKLVAGGKDPQPVTSADFWMQAMAQGGGLGIMGDFVNSATSRFDNDIYSTALGPVTTTAVDAVKAARSKHKARSLERLIASNLPGSSLWYAKLAFQREVMDQLMAQTDPDYWEAFNRMEKRAQETNSPYYWRPGQAVPDRSPNLANAAGTQ